MGPAVLKVFRDGLCFVITLIATRWMGFRVSGFGIIAKYTGNQCVAKEIKENQPACHRIHRLFPGDAGNPMGANQSGGEGQA